MGLFEKRERLYINPKTRKSKWVKEGPKQGPRREPLTHKIKESVKKEYNTYMTKRQHEKDIYNTAYKKARDKGLEKKAQMKAYEDLGIRKINHVRKTKSGKRRTYSTYDYTQNYNPIGTTWDSGVPSGKKRKRKEFDPVDNWGFL
jgi:hypothetical protein